MEIEGKRAESRQFRNQGTQPTVMMPVFNNPDVVAEGWYYAGTARSLKPGQHKAFELCGQDLVLWRGQDGKVRCTDAYCPHMGTHLGAGRVQGNHIRCFFHHWTFDGEGQCQKVPCQDEIPPRAKLRAYQVLEKYDSLWVSAHASNQKPPELADFPELRGQELKVIAGKAYERSCHHHVTMINGLDPQHLRTVHHLDIDLQLEMTEDHPALVDFTLSGKIGQSRWAERFVHWLFGGRYAYSMRYDHANNGLLTLMKNVRLRGHGWQLPSLHMIFAYVPLEGGRTRVQPLYVTKRRTGLLGLFIERLLLWMTKRAFFALQSEDGQVYENMRFYPANLLPMDRPIAAYIQYVNRLELSDWSASKWNLKSPSRQSKPQPSPLASAPPPF